MDEQVVWSDDSLMNLSTDEPVSSSGTVSTSGANITLGSTSNIYYRYEFGTTGTLVRTNKLQFSLNILSSNNLLETRYNEAVYVLVKIQYWKEDTESETGFSPGAWDVARVYPYVRNETEGYSLETILDLQNNYVNTLEVIFTTGDIGDATITIYNPTIKKAISVNEAISGFSGSAQLQSIDIYSNGMVAYYVDEEMPVTFQVETVVENETYRINQSGRLTFNMSFHNGEVPWER